MTASVVASDLACEACGYNLRTLSNDGVCPECGTAVAGEKTQHLTGG